MLRCTLDKDIRAPSDTILILNLREPMQKSMLRTSYLLFAVIASPALAQNVSPEGAKQVSGALASYLGPSVVDKGILTVTVEGTAYRVSFDLEKAMEGAVKAAPLSFLTTPQADGTWDVKAEGSNEIVIPPSGEGKQPMTFWAKDFSMQGTFDPELGTFTKATSKIGSYGTSQSEGKVSATTDYTNIVTDMTSVPAKGGATISFTQSIDGVTQKMMAESVPIVIKLGAIKGGSKLEGVRTKELLGMWAFIVANMAQTNTAEAGAQLKDRLMAALPFWQNAVGDVSVDGITVEMPMGSVKIAEFEEKITMSGLVPKGTFGLAFRVKGLELTAGMAPEWTKALIPTDFDISADMTDVNLDAASRIFLNAMDITDKDLVSDETWQQIAAVLMMGQPKITLAPGGLKTETLKLSFNGSGGFAPPAGKVTVEAEGLDETLATLGKADDEKAKEATQSLTMAKGLAQESGGKHVWVIEALGNAFTVNGKPLGQ